LAERQEELLELEYGQWLYKPQKRPLVEELILESDANEPHRDTWQDFLAKLQALK
jgi:hypothetical protein